MTSKSAPPTSRAPLSGPVDAVVVGAGFGGLYALHCLRQAGFSAVAFETGDGVGGTWYWNRYPGARCDVESLQYSYSFSEDLDQEWNWSEKYAPQPEILSYANHVADRFDLRRDIRFSTRVVAATFDEARALWVVETERLDGSGGDRVEARFCIMAVGCLSSANKPPFAGMADFKGPIYHTGEWPKDGVDFTGLRVGVIGTGSSAIQSIPLIAEQAKALTVFQRTPNYSVPAYNAPLDPAYVAEVKANYPALRAKARSRPTGFYFPFNTQPALASTPEERRRQYEEAWARGGLPFLGAYGDLLFNKEANDTIAEFAREKIRGIVKDPKTAELLCPENVFGCKRLCVDTNYFATYNKPHVSLVDVSKTPIERFTANGLAVGGKTYELDAVVCATGFAAMTGAFDKIRITGRGGLTLAEKWQAGPRTYLGVASAGFPNLFMVTGPGSPSVLASMIQAIEQHVDWMVDMMAHLRDVGARTFEARAEDEDRWVAHVNEVSQVSLRSTCSSWYVGANVPGRPRVFMPYIGGFPVYVQKCNEEMDGGYGGFVLDGATTRNAPPEIRLTRRWHVPLDMDVISPAMLAARQVPVV
ncbi:MAG: NAD(P)/FAD-dependent oxidoreductase [Proteobacteria bacterium]|nr:NAD(P)/FAD-dependent oxidoreductase [Pseudomonadota bacterium]